MRQLLVPAGEQLLPADRAPRARPAARRWPTPPPPRPGAAARTPGRAAAPRSARRCSRPVRSARTAAASARSVTVASVAALAASRGRRAEPQAQQHPARAGTDERPGEQEQRAGTASMPAGCRAAPTDPGEARRATRQRGRRIGERSNMWSKPRCGRALQQGGLTATRIGAGPPCCKRSDRAQRCASWSSSHRFTGSPQRNPPSDPSLRSTRWHGTNSAAALRAHADAAARTAAGRPAFAAYSV